MTYIIIEMQTTNGVTAIVPPASYIDRQAAESKFHQVLSAAAVSQVEEHACVMFTSDGRMVRTECYKHAPQQQEEEETEGE